MAEIPDDTGLKAALRGILNEADLEQLTKRAARRQLETKLGLAEGALDDRKGQIGDWVDEVMHEKDKEEAAAEPDVKEESEAESSEEEAAPAKPAKKKGGGGFGEAYLKPALQEFTGLEKCARSQVVKMIWEWVKANDLQDPKDKRYICVDDKLRPLFPSKKRIHMFSMNKELTKHFGERAQSDAPSKKKAKKESESEDEESEEESEDDDEEGGSRKRKAASASKPAAKKKKAGGGGGGFAAPVNLSPELAALLDGVSTMPRTQVVKELWAYIKSNERQDPENRKWIIPDSKMRPVFGNDKFTGFSMMKILKPHIFKIE